MMNLDAIRKTTVCYWSVEDDCYVVESSLFDSLAGVGDTEAEAMQSFEDMLSDALEAFHQGRVPKDKAGRPSKHTVPLNTDVKPETKEYIAALAKDFGCSQGEAIDFVVLFHDKKKAVLVQAKSKKLGGHVNSVSVKELMESIERALLLELKKAPGITVVGLGTFEKKRRSAKPAKVLAPTKAVARQPAKKARTTT